MARYVHYLLAISALALTGCASDNIGNSASEEPNSAEMLSSKTIVLTGDATVTIGRSALSNRPVLDIPMSRGTACLNENCKGDEDHPNHKRLELTVEDSGLDVREYVEYILENFPERERNLEIEHPDLHEFTGDFTYYANGEPITVVPLYTGAGNNYNISVFYYDENGVYHQQGLWGMGVGDWKEGDISEEIGISPAIINTDGKGITFTLPKGTEYGFLAYTSATGRHFTKVDENIIHGIPDYMPNPNKVTAIQFTHKGVECIGFEGLWDGDEDFNDVIIAVTPHQKLRPRDRNDVTIDFGSIDVDFTCQSDDTNIKMGDVLLPINQIDNTFNLKLDGGDIFSVAFDRIWAYDEYWHSVSPELDELVFDIRLYNYNVTKEQVFELFGLNGEDVEKYADDSYNLHGHLGSDYIYTVNVGVTDSDIHLSFIIQRFKNNDPDRKR